MVIEERVEALGRLTISLFKTCVQNEYTKAYVNVELKLSTSDTITAGWIRG